MWAWWSLQRASPPPQLSQQDGHMDNASHTHTPESSVLPKSFKELIKRSFVDLEGCPCPVAIIPPAEKTMLCARLSFLFCKMTSKNCWAAL